MNDEAGKNEAIFSNWGFMLFSTKKGENLMGKQTHIRAFVCECCVYVCARANGAVLRRACCVVIPSNAFLISIFNGHHPSLSERESTTRRTPPWAKQPKAWGMKLLPLKEVWQLELHPEHTHTHIHTLSWSEMGYFRFRDIFGHFLHKKKPDLWRKLEITYSALQKSRFQIGEANLLEAVDKLYNWGGG